MSNKKSNKNFDASLDNAGLSQWEKAAITRKRNARLALLKAQAAKAREAKALKAEQKIKEFDKKFYAPKVAKADAKDIIKEVTSKDTPVANATKYTVETGVDMKVTRFTNAWGTFPFSSMNVGDSFEIPSDDPLVYKPHIVVTAANMYARLKPGFKVATRKTLTGTRRVWRIS